MALVCSYNFVLVVFECAYVLSESCVTSNRKTECCCIRDNPIWHLVVCLIILPVRQFLYVLHAKHTVESIIDINWKIREKYNKFVRNNCSYVELVWKKKKIKNHSLVDELSSHCYLRKDIILTDLLCSFLFWDIFIYQLCYCCDDWS